MRMASIAPVMVAPMAAVPMARCLETKWTGWDGRRVEGVKEQWKSLFTLVPR
jgi:hypothetical protein